MKIPFNYNPGGRERYHLADPCICKHNDILEYNSQCQCPDRLTESLMCSKMPKAESEKSMEMDYDNYYPSNDQLRASSNPGSFRHPFRQNQNYPVKNDQLVHPWNSPSHHLTTGHYNFALPETSKVFNTHNRFNHPKSFNSFYKNERDPPTQEPPPSFSHPLQPKASSPKSKSPQPLTAELHHSMSALDMSNSSFSCQELVLTSNNSPTSSSIYSPNGVQPHEFSSPQYPESSYSNGSTMSESYSDMFPLEPLDLSLKTNEERGANSLDDQDKSDEHRWLKKIKTGTRSRVRSPKSWEFLVRLLLDPQTNPSLIKWEDEKEGTFRLVNKEEIARIWGTRSEKNKGVSYDNFARNLRYHYKTQMMAPVSEKHLVYKFGDKILEGIRVGEFIFD